MDQHEFEEIFKPWGIVHSNKDGIIEVLGLPDAFVGEVLTFDEAGTLIGFVATLERKTIKVVLLGDEKRVFEGDVCVSTGHALSFKLDWSSLGGRVVDSLCNYIEEDHYYPGLREEIYADGSVPYSRRYVEADAPSIISRQAVNDTLWTGTLIVDALIPIGRGQRELIVGDRVMGKSTIAIDTILAHREVWREYLNELSEFEITEYEEGDLEYFPADLLYCVYAAIGQRRVVVRDLMDLLDEEDVLWYTTIVASTCSEAAGLVYLAPYTACAVGEYYRDMGADALVIYDDLSKHAVAYRAMSLLLRRPPGREAYPGDVFYVHSRLLERAAKLSDVYGGGSLTALPVIETLGSDLTAYIPTNVISITDGQIFLERELFYRGIRPAVNAGLSVSRIGAAAQPEILNEFVGSLKHELATYRDLEIFKSFSNDIDAGIMRILVHGNCLVEILKQDPHMPKSLEEGLILIFAARNRFLDGLNDEGLEMFKEFFVDVFTDEDDTLRNYLTHLLELEDIIIRDLVLADVISQVVTMIAEEGGVTPVEESGGGA